MKEGLTVNCEEAIAYIHGTLKFGSKLGLYNITELLSRLGNPHHQYPIIHIAGTNGKGSVTAMLTAVLQAAGYRTGMFTSPYLERFTERIQTNLQEIPSEALAVLTGQVKAQVDRMTAEGFNHPTEFEIVTAIGFLYFAQQKVDYALVEVGLGGRLDATNVVDPILSVITAIGFDHMEYLGNTLSLIAYEKGGIIKPGRPVVSYPQDAEALRVLQDLAEQRQAPFTLVSKAQVREICGDLTGQTFDFAYRERHFPGIRCALAGCHQLLNAATALTALCRLEEMGRFIPEAALYQGLASTRWPGRLEVLCQNPLVILDGAHNAAGAAALEASIRKLIPDTRIHLIFGILQDKDVEGVIARLCPLAHRITLVRPKSPRALSPADLKQRICSMLPAAFCPAIDMAEAPGPAAVQAYQCLDPREALLISGSLYMIGDARSALNLVLK